MGGGLLPYGDSLLWCIPRLPLLSSPVLLLCPVAGLLLCPVAGLLPRPSVLPSFYPPTPVSSSLLPPTPPLHSGVPMGPPPTFSMGRGVTVPGLDSQLLPLLPAGLFLGSPLWCLGYFGDEFSWHPFSLQGNSQAHWEPWCLEFPWTRKKVRQLIHKGACATVVLLISCFSETTILVAFSCFFFKNNHNMNALSNWSMMQNSPHIHSITASAPQKRMRHNKSATLKTLWWNLTFYLLDNFILNDVGFPSVYWDWGISLGFLNIFFLLSSITISNMFL